MTCPGNRICREGHRLYFESFQKANLLRKRYEKHNPGVQYDLVIKCRPDVLLKTPLDLRRLDPGTIHLFGNPARGGATQTHYSLGKLDHFQAVNVITITGPSLMDRVADFACVADRYIDGKQRHTDYSDYILDLKVPWVIQDYIYKRDWSLERLK